MSTIKRSVMTLFSCPKSELSHRVRIVWPRKPLALILLTLIPIISRGTLRDQSLWHFANAG